ncbi:MAG TPA: hypothetical protein VJ792_04285 [Candidatus Nitrosotalea sp.]|nr:hypothetical protein [Candidatus Nitrosotalea sp.]
MSASATNVARDTNAVDYLSWLRLYVQSNQAAQTAGTNFTPEYIMQVGDTIDITDAVSLGALESVSDTIDITDSFTVTNYPGTIGSAVIDFSVIN